MSPVDILLATLGFMLAQGLELLRRIHPILIKLCLAISWLIALFLLFI